MIISMYYFGRECVMVVNKIKKLYGLVALTCCVSFSTAYADNLKNEVIALAKKNIQIAVANLGERTEFCEQQRKTRPIPVLSHKYLQSINAARHDVLIGLAYLSFRARDQCEGDLRMQWAYAVGYLKTAQEHYKLNSDNLKEIEVGLIYPSEKEMGLTVQFNKLPGNLKKYLIETMGARPFDLIKSINANKLSALQ